MLAHRIESSVHERKTRTAVPTDDKDATFAKSVKVFKARDKEAEGSFLFLRSKGLT